MDTFRIQMKSRWGTLFLTLTSVTELWCESPAPIGCVVYTPRYSSTPVFELYLKYEDRGQFVALAAPDGDEIRIFHGLNPIFVPFPNDKSASREFALQQIALAERRAPNHRLKIGAVKNLWLNSVPAPEAKAVNSRKTKVAGSRLVLSDGSVYLDWTVVAVEGEYAQLSHAYGTATVPIKLFPRGIPDPNRKASGEPAVASGVLERTNEEISFAKNTTERTHGDLERIRKFIPSEVTVSADIEFPIMIEGKQFGVGRASRGTTARVVHICGEKLLLEHDSQQQLVPVTSTDFLERVVAEAEK